MSSPAVCHKNLPTVLFTPETETSSRTSGLVSIDRSASVDRLISKASPRVISMAGVAVRDSAFSQYARGIAKIQKAKSAGVNIVGQRSDRCVGVVMVGSIDFGAEGCQAMFLSVFGKVDQTPTWYRRTRIMTIGSSARRVSIARSNQTPGPVV